MSCAQHLSQHPEKFDVTLIDAVDYCGGQAFAIPIDQDKHGVSWLNQGVQGGSYIFHHSMTMFARQGHHADPVKLQVGLWHVPGCCSAHVVSTGVFRQGRQVLDKCFPHEAAPTTYERDQAVSDNA